MIAKGKLIISPVKSLAFRELENWLNRRLQVIGIGDVCANGLAIYLPELGHYSNKVIAAIVGVAPYCKESGKYKGKSKIKGGRHKLRSILYMVILSAIKYNKVINKFYYRLKKEGKAHNVAMIACMRKCYAFSMLWSEIRLIGMKIIGLLKVKIYLILTQL